MQSGGEGSEVRIAQRSHTRAPCAMRSPHYCLLTCLVYDFDYVERSTCTRHGGTRQARLSVSPSDSRARPFRFRFGASCGDCWVTEVSTVPSGRRRGGTWRSPGLSTRLADTGLAGRHAALRCLHVTVS